MKLSDEYRLLGMGREITRRDFLNGVAIGVTSAYLAGAGSGLVAAQNAPSSDGATEYPPLRSQLRGNYPEAVAEFDNVRAGRYAQFPVPADEVKEEASRAYRPRISTAQRWGTTRKSSFLIITTTLAATPSAMSSTTRGKLSSGTAERWRSPRPSPTATPPRH